jgi:hypothetical protein
MAELASIDELEARLRVEFDAAEKDAAKKLIELASGLVQRAARQTIAEVKDDELRMRGSREFAIRLPERPITSIKSVTLDGTELNADDFYIDGADLVRRRGTVADISDGSRCLIGWGNPDVEMMVVYTHGWALKDIPAAIKAVVLESVTRVWVNPGAATQERYGSEAAEYRATGMTLTKDERRTVREAVRVGSGSVPIR